MKNIRRFVTSLLAMWMIFTTSVVAYAAPVTSETILKEEIYAADGNSDDEGIMPYSMYNGQWIPAGEIPIDSITVTAPRKTGKIYGTFKIESDDPYAQAEIVGLGSIMSGKVDKTFQARDGEVKFEFDTGGSFILPGPSSYTFKYYVHRNTKGMRINIWLY